MIGAGLLFLLPGAAANGRWTGVRQAGSTGEWCCSTVADSPSANCRIRPGSRRRLGNGMTEWLPLSGEFGLLVASTVVATLVSEATSNTGLGQYRRARRDRSRAAAAVDPLNRARGDDGFEPRFHVASVNTVQRHRLRQRLHSAARMIRYGALLDVAEVIVVIAMVRLVVPWIR